MLLTPTSTIRLRVLLHLLYPPTHEADFKRNRKIRLKYFSAANRRYIGIEMVKLRNLKEVACHSQVTH